MARENWATAAGEILGTPVADAVPVPRIRSNAWKIDIAGLAVISVLILVDLFVASFPTLIVLLICAVLSGIGTRLRQTPRFAALTQDSRLWMLTATYWFSRPSAPIGPIDPGLVSGPVGLFRLTFIIDGAKHTVARPHRESFQRMVEAARPLPTDSERS